jgi:ATP-dependent DNA helicase RecQ
MKKLNYFFVFILNSYQVPPLVVKKTGIVVSPLISLMQDQAS